MNLAAHPILGHMTGNKIIPRRRNFGDASLDCTSDLSQAVIQNVQTQSNGFIQQLAPLLNAVTAATQQNDFFIFALQNINTQYLNAVPSSSASFQYPSSGQAATDLAALGNQDYTVGMTIDPSNGSATLTVRPWSLANFPNYSGGTLPTPNVTNPQFAANIVSTFQPIYTTLYPYAQQYQNILAQKIASDQALGNANIAVTNVQDQIGTWSLGILGTQSYIPQINSTVTTGASPYVACLSGIPVSVTDVTNAAQSLADQIATSTSSQVAQGVPQSTSSSSTTTPDDSSQSTVVVPPPGALPNSYSGMVMTTMPVNTPVVSTVPTNPPIAIASAPASATDPNQIDQTSDSQAIQAAAAQPSLLDQPSVIPIATPVIGPSTPSPSPIDETAASQLLQSAAAQSNVPVVASGSTNVSSLPTPTLAAPQTQINPYLIGGVALLALLLLTRK